MTDEALMARVQQGNREAYDTLYGRWGERTFAFLLRRTQQAAEAADAQQEAWLRVYRWRHRYDPRRPFRPWLFTIAANAGRDAARPAPEHVVIAPEPHEPTELRDLLVSALAALDPDDRKLLLLAIEGFDGNEIAEMLGISPPAARARLSRARERVRTALATGDADA